MVGASSSLAVGAVTLRVADLPGLVGFYRDVVGLGVRRQADGFAELGTPDRALVVLRHLPGGRPPGRTTGLFHLALRVSHRRDLAHWLRHYAEAGGPHWQGASDHGVSEALYLSDPEGNGIEVYWDRPRAEWPARPDGTYDMYTRALAVQELLGKAPPTPWNGLPDTTDMGHIHLKVHDIEAVRPFYVDGLGLGIKTEMRGSALFLAAGDYHHHVGMNTWNSRGAPPAPADALGLEGCTLVYPDETARRVVLDRLGALGCAVGETDDAPLVRDPSGNLLRLAVE